MRDKIWGLLVKLLLLAILSFPFVFLYYLITDPVNAIVTAIGVYLWLIIVVFPGILILVILFGFFGLVSGILTSIFDILKSLFK